MGNFIGMVFAVLKDNGIDTKGMSTEEAVEKYNELGGEDNWSEKSGSYEKKIEEEKADKEKTKKEKTKEFFKSVSEKLREIDDNFFGGKDNIERTNKRLYIKDHILSDDEILLTTSNVEYWRNKETYVMWIDNDKVVYLKPWQVKKVYEYELGREEHIVKLNRNYFKPYKSFTSDKFMFNKQDSFDDLFEMAKIQGSKDKETKRWYRLEK